MKRSLRIAIGFLIADGIIVCFLLFLITSMLQSNPDFTQLVFSRNTPTVITWALPTPNPITEPPPTQAPVVEVTPSPAPSPTPQGVVGPFLRDYTSNSSYSQIAESRPWANTSVNRWQYSQTLGGVSLWDYFASAFGQNYEEDWNSQRYGWLDDKGEWQSYHTEAIKDNEGKDTTGYVIVDRTGTGVVDKMVFTLYSVASRPKDTDLDLFEWGYLSHLGRLRIEVDDQIAYDVYVEDWFSAKAVCLPSELARPLFWRYRDFGSNGSILPIPYRKHIKILTYGGVEKPKWFTFTGVALPPGTKVTPYSGCLDQSTQEEIKRLLPNVASPETYLDRSSAPSETVDLKPSPLGESSIPIDSNDTQYRLALGGAGTIEALEFRVPKTYDPSKLYLRVSYGNEVGIDIPFMAFFSDQDRLVKHRSTPIGVVDDPDDPNSLLFYSNFPLPYQKGIAIELWTRGDPVVVKMTYAQSSEIRNTQLRIVYKALGQSLLEPQSPDYVATLPGDGKLVGVVLVTRDQKYDLQTIPQPPAGEYQGTIVFPMGYIESNVTLKDGTGATRIYCGLEDFADGGYDFDSDLGPGAKNLPFAGVLGFSWNPLETGYFTIFRYFNDLSAFRFKQGLTLAFQHGSWENNFPVRYGLTVFYYSEVK